MSPRERAKSMKCVWCGRFVAYEDFQVEYHGVMDIAGNVDEVAELNCKRCFNRPLMGKDQA